MKPGEKMSDGTVYAGISPDTAEQLYVMPANAGLLYTFNQAQKYADGRNSRRLCGHNDWRVPTKNELNVLFNNNAAIGGFDVRDLNGISPDGWYWSSSSFDDMTAWGQQFGDGHQVRNDKNGLSSVRLVRTEAPGTVKRREEERSLAIDRTAHTAIELQKDIKLKKPFVFKS